MIRNIKLIAFDFDGVFTDNMVYVSEEGIESVRCCRSDGIGLSKLRKLGFEMIIISTETNPVVTTRSRKLKLPCLQGIEDKLAALTDVIEKNGVSPQETAFMGNDINDLSCLRYVGLPIGVADSYEEIVPYLLYRTTKPGGSGAVREVCDLFERAFHGVEARDNA